MKKSQSFLRFTKSFLLSFLFLLFFALLIILWTLSSTPNHQPIVMQSPSSTVYLPDEDEVLTIFIAGCVTRASVAEYFYILRYEKNKINIFPLPSKSVATVDGKKFNLSKFYDYGGTEMALSAAENIFEIKIDRYIRVDFNTLSNIVDFFGGITYNLEHDIIYKDSKNEVDINLEKGYQTLDGRRFAALMRYEDDALDEIVQINRRTFLLCEFLSKHLNKNISEETDNILSLLLEMDGNINDYDIVSRKQGFQSLLENNLLTVNAIELTGTFQNNGVFEFSSESIVNVKNNFMLY